MCLSRRVCQCLPWSPLAPAPLPQGSQKLCFCNYYIFRNFLALRKALIIDERHKGKIHPRAIQQNIQHKFVYCRNQSNHPVWQKDDLNHSASTEPFQYKNPWVVISPKVIHMCNNFKAYNLAGFGCKYFNGGVGKQQLHCNLYNIVTAPIREVKYYSGLQQESVFQYLQELTNCHEKTFVDY